MRAGISKCSRPRSRGERMLRRNENRIASRDSRRCFSSHLSRLGANWIFPTDLVPADPRFPLSVARATSILDSVIM